MIEAGAVSADNASDPVKVIWNHFGVNTWEF